MFRWAAAQNDPHAMAFLGSMYASGLGVEQDNTTAFQWLQKSANAGSAAGQSGLGLLYLHGQGVARDYEKAAQVRVT
jgi:TPR repeat protein